MVRYKPCDMGDTKIKNTAAEGDSAIYGLMIAIATLK
jgi:hypothetical protein